MNFVAYDLEYGDPADPASVDAHLRFELGWSEVRRGLAGILRGNLIIIAAFIVVVTALCVVLGMEAAERGKIPWQVRDLSLFLGGAVFACAVLYGYGSVVVGHWRCLMNAPERCGAKWLMFACLTCILAGPAMNVAAGISGVQRAPRLDRGWDGVQQFRYAPEGVIMQLASASVQVLGGVFFLLFLRAVARCFEDSRRVLLVHVYLVYMLCLAGATIFVFLICRDLESLAAFGLLLGLGWLVNVVGYLTVIAICRAGITQHLHKPRAPAGLDLPWSRP